jgi:hypothetical protein
MLAALVNMACLSTTFAGQPAAPAKQVAHSMAFSTSPARAEWRQEMAMLKPSTPGCFHATYPDSIPRPMPCKPAPDLPLVPPPVASADISKTVGNTNDYVLKAAPSVLIAQSTGSFPQVTGVTSVIDSHYGLGNYSLQLNTNIAKATSACLALSESCKSVWEQFVYTPNFGGLSIEYWMFGDFLTSGCPSHWTGLRYYCVRSSHYNTPTPYVPVMQLNDIHMSAYATKGGQDGIVFQYGDDVYYLVGENPLDIGQVWTESEFNIFGAGGGSQLDFNAGSSLTVHVSAEYDETDTLVGPPTCVGGEGTTGETNNLTLGKCFSRGRPVTRVPFIQFTESN